MGENTNLSVQRTLYNQVKEFIKKNPLWRSVTQFFEESARLRLEGLEKKVANENKEEA